MRLLHAGHDHDGGEPEPVAASGSALGIEGQHLPLHRLWRDRKRHSRRPPDRDTPKPARPAAAACRRRRPARSSAAHARYTLDVAPAGLLHLKLLRSPHAHARIKSIRKDEALAVPGVRAVLTWEDAPRKLYSTARHEDESGDPDDTVVA